MKLAIVSYHASPSVVAGAGVNGGMNVYVRELVSHVARLGVDCQIFTRQTTPDEPRHRRLEPGIELITLPAGPFGELSPEQNYHAIGEFSDRLLEHLAPLSGDLAAVHGNYWLSGIAAHRVKHEFGIPMLTTFHTLEKAKALYGGMRDSVLSSVRTYQEHRILGCSDAVLVAAPPEADWLRSLYGARGDQIRTVSLGVDPCLFSPGDKAHAKQAIGRPSHRPLIMYAGRIQRLKGTSLAVEAMAAITSKTSADLVIIGGPSGEDGAAEYSRIARIVKSSHLEDHVQILVPQPHEVLSTYYRAADICVVPSETESFGLVALEASACGTPVVATNAGGLKAVVKDGCTGILVKDRSPEHFADAVLSLLNDARLREVYGSNAAREALRSTWRSSALSYLNVLEDLDPQSQLSCERCA